MKINRIYMNCNSVEVLRFSKIMKILTVTYFSKCRRSPLKSAQIDVRLDIDNQ